MNTRKAMTKSRLVCYIGASYCRGPVKLAPQESRNPYTPTFQYRGRTFIYLPVCQFHWNGWWDGSDIPPCGRPPLIRVPVP